MRLYIIVRCDSFWVRCNKLPIFMSTDAMVTHTTRSICEIIKLAWFFHYLRSVYHPNDDISGYFCDMTPTSRYVIECKIIQWLLQPYEWFSIKFVRIIDFDRTPYRLPPHFRFIFSTWHRLIVDAIAFAFICYVYAMKLIHAKLIIATLMFFF